MYFRDYQHAAMKTAVFESHLYPIMSLVIEAAEFADLFVKPELRGDDGYPSKEKIMSEAGDVLWNLAVALKQFDINLDEVAEANIKKLLDRAHRGVLKGSGGDR
jgi:NTP pyrophosphatase (non-canonical NTP hydrolase)